MAFLNTRARKMKGASTEAGITGLRNMMSIECGRWVGTIHLKLMYILHVFATNFTDGSYEIDSFLSVASPRASAGGSSSWNFKRYACKWVVFFLIALSTGATSFPIFRLLPLDCCLSRWSISRRPVMRMVLLMGLLIYKVYKQSQDYTGGYP